MTTELEALRLDADRVPPRHALVYPVLPPVVVGAGFHEELHLHLLELTDAEDEVAGGYLIAKGFAGLSDAERDLQTGAVQDVAEVDEDALGGFRPQIRQRGVVGDRPHVSREHGVELANLAEF